MIQSKKQYETGEGSPLEEESDAREEDSNMEDGSDVDEEPVEETDDEDLDDDDALGDDDIGEEENDQNGSTDEEEEWGGISENTAIAGQESIAAESFAEAPSGKYPLVRIWLGTESAS